MALGKHKPGYRKSNRSRMKDVAVAAGVSIGTVDRVLHKRGRVAPETADRVLSAARDLSFEPNPAASSLSRSRPHVIAVVLPVPEQDGGYWNLVVRGVERAMEELAQAFVEVEFLFYNRFDPASFEIITAGLVNQDIDGVILAPTLATASRALVEQLGERSVVLIDGDLPGTRVLATISQDSLESGMLAAKLLDILCPTRTFLSVTVGTDDHHLQLRRKGFENYFAAVHPSTETQVARLEHLVIANNNEWEKLDAWFRDTRVVEGVFVTNSAAHEVVSRLPAGSEPHIVGYDLIPENARCLEDGRVEFIINQQPENQGYQALHTLYRARVLNETVPAVVRMPIGLVMRENLSFHPVNTDS